jgi:hypothetical protein
MVENSNDAGAIDSDLALLAIGAQSWDMYRVDIFTGVWYHENRDNEIRMRTQQPAMLRGEKAHSSPLQVPTRVFSAGVRRDCRAIRSIHMALCLGAICDWGVRLTAKQPARARRASDAAQRLTPTTPRCAGEAKCATSK